MEDKDGPGGRHKNLAFPEEMQGGQMLQSPLPYGRIRQVPVPNGVAPGGQFSVTTSSLYGLVRKKDMLLCT